MSTTPLFLACTGCSEKASVPLAEVGKVRKVKLNITTGWQENLVELMICPHVPAGRYQFSFEEGK